MAMENNKALALRVIHDAKLGHPDLPLVESFLHDAVDGDQAARYLLQTCMDDSTGIQFSGFVEDWKALVKQFYVVHPSSGFLDSTIRRTITKRDNYRCCITGVRGRFWNTWKVFPIIPLNAFHIREQRLYDILGAFITPTRRDLLFSFKDGNENSIQTHWVLSMEAAKAFSTGEIRLENSSATKYHIRYNSICGIPPAIYTPERHIVWRCNLADHSNAGIDSPSLELFAIHRHFSRALKWTKVAAHMERNPNVRRVWKTTHSQFSQVISTSILAVWLKFPDIIRLQAYRLLKAAGSYFYGSDTIGVQRLPFGMYLKYGPEIESDRHSREFNALKLVRSRTSIPVPIPIDLISSSNGSILVTSKMEGDLAGLSIDECSDQEMSLMAQDLKSWIAELRAIEMGPGSSYAISDVSGGACLDYRMDSSPVGPFHDEKEFSDSLRLGILPALVHRDDHKIVFTHSDLNLRNILVKDGRISAIIDWENAGWYPEYWEYTKCHFSVKFSQRWLRMIEEVFEHKYGEELKIERQYWEYQSAW